jgi:hypothetical protein
MPSLSHDTSISYHSSLVSYHFHLGPLLTLFLQQQNGGMNPSGPVFTPGMGFSASQGHSSSNSSAFRTPAKGSAMKFLNLGSTPDGPSTKASSLSPVKPIGSGFSSPSRQSMLKDGPPFSTDADPNIAETRFVRFGMIPTVWVEDGILIEVLHGVSFPRFHHDRLLTFS